MAFRSTGIYNSNKEFHNILDVQVNLCMKRNVMKKMKNFLFKTSLCSQCNRPMKKTTADLQIENKREKAPICVACILGIHRRPKYIVKQRTKFTRKAFKKFQQRRKEYSK